MSDTGSGGDDVSIIEELKALRSRLKKLELYVHNEIVPVVNEDNKKIEAMDDTIKEMIVRIDKMIDKDAASHMLIESVNINVEKLHKLMKEHHDWETNAYSSGVKTLPAVVAPNEDD